MANPVNSPTALVTGASRGIGRATAELLLREGFDVHATYANREDSAAELSSYAKGLGRKLTLHRYAAESRDSQDRLLEELSGIKLRAVVHNAGCFLPVHQRVSIPFVSE